MKKKNGQEIINSRLLLYTDDDGNAWLQALLSAKMVRTRKQGAGVADSTNVLQSFFSIVADVMLDKATQWATHEIVNTGLWSIGGALAGDIPSYGILVRWEPCLRRSSHAGSRRVCAITRQFELEYIGQVTDGDTLKGQWSLTFRGVKAVRFGR